MQIYKFLQNCASFNAQIFVESAGTNPVLTGVSARSQNYPITGFLTREIGLTNSRYIFSFFLARFSTVYLL